MDIKEISNAIMELFKKLNYKEGAVLLPQMILKFYQDLSTPEKELFDYAIHDLKSQNLITIEDAINSKQYRLTKTGYEYIYNK